MCDWGPVTERNPVWFLSEGTAMAKKRPFKANTKAPRGSYAVPPGSPVGGKGVAKYPIHDKAHARNALARVSQHGSTAEKRMVRAAVKRKFPAIGKKKKK